MPGYFIGFDSMFANLARVWHESTDSVTKHRIKNIQFDMQLPSNRELSVPRRTSEGGVSVPRSLPQAVTTTPSPRSGPASAAPLPSQGDEGAVEELQVQDDEGVPDHSNDDDQYAVESLMDRRVTSSGVEYLVKWAGYAHSHDEWVLSEDIEQGMVTDYNNLHVSLITSFTPPPSKQMPEGLRWNCVSGRSEPLPQSVFATYTEHDEVHINFTVLEKLYDALDPDDIKNRQDFCHILQVNSTTDMSWVKTLADPQLAPKAVASCDKELHSLSQTIFQLIDPTDVDEMKRAKEEGTKCRMLLNIKRNGTVKSRLVKQGFLENCVATDGPNYNYYCAVTRLTQVRTSAFRPNRGSDVIACIDLDTAFLQSDKFEINKHKYCYFRHPVTKVWHYYRQLAPIYGEKSAPSRWFATMTPHLIKLGFVQGKNDPCAFLNNKGLRLLIYVDDVWCDGPREEIEIFVAMLRKRFKAKEIEWLTESTPIDFLGMLFSIENGRICLSMASYIDKVMESLEPQAFGMTSAEVKLPITKQVTDLTLLNREQKQFYMSGTGCIGWLNATGRPDIMLLYSRLSQHLASPCVGALEVLLHGLAYLNQHKDWGLSASLSGTEGFAHYSDSDFAGDIEIVAERVSTNCHITTLNHAPVEWSGKKSSVCFPHPGMTKAAADVSSASVEIYAAGNASRTVIGNSYQAEEIGIFMELPFRLQIDNEAAIAFIYDRVSRSKLRHIDCRQQWVVSLRDQSIMLAIHVPSKYNKADLGTKIHAYPTFTFLRSMIMTNMAAGTS